MSLPLGGNDCLLRISDGEESPTFLLVEGVRLSGWTISHDEVEVTDAGDEGWRRLLPGAGLRSLELKLSGLYLGSAGERLLRDCAFSGAAFGCVLTLDHAEAVRGRFIAVKLQMDSAINEEATYAATLRSAGPVVIN
ncbi:phage tail tube protein [Sphingomonas sp. LHG3443-2]|uniref:phage tail tube protein n=1 Tax=Sphingomonas sp. LHG3443-2 TaxID=2804639 RepID=UPI003CF6C5D2